LFSGARNGRRSWRSIGAVVARYNLASSAGADVHAASYSLSITRVQVCQPTSQPVQSRSSVAHGTGQVSNSSWTILLRVLYGLTMARSKSVGSTPQSSGKRRPLLPVLSLDRPY